MKSTPCPKCGGSYVQFPFSGACPGCAFSTAFSTNQLWGEFFHADGRARVVSASGGRLKRIGPYTFTRILGEGGMGIVWEADQAFPVERKVALKMLRRDLASADLLERFDHERHSLARMNHRGIVRIFETGETEGGDPYFVMELVSGTPITRFCDKRQLPLRDRLKLYLDVAYAVQHAHQKGVIHRDLKPSNVLVSEDNEDEAAVKLIDFGIAKTLAAAAGDATMLTLSGQIIGTPQYMSPEQAAEREVDTRTDIYGMGAILYELISGSPPIPEERVANVSVEEVLRLVREFEPERPSLRIERLRRGKGERSPGTPSGWHRRWQRELREELDWITLRCLEKDPDRRYESIGALCDDLNGYLEGNPVKARPPSSIYRLKKFTHRNRVLVGSMVAIATILTVATAFSVQWAYAADEARKLAEKRLAQTDAVPDFLFHAFRQADRSQGGAEMLALDVLREAEKDVDDEFAEQPVIRARLQESIGMTYQDLGRSDLAAVTLNAALESYRSVPGNEEAVRRLSDPTITAMRDSGASESAISLSEREWHDREVVFGKDHETAHEARLNHCRTLLEAAFWNDEMRVDYLHRVETIVGEVINAPHQFPGANIRSYEALVAQHAAGSGDHATALAFWESEMNLIFMEGSAAKEERFWPNSFHVAALRRNERYDEAAASAESCLLYCREFFGLHHANSTTASRALAIVYGMMKLPEEAFLVCRILKPEPGEKVDPLFVAGLDQLAEWSGGLNVTVEEKTRIEGLVSAIKSGIGGTRESIEAVSAGREGMLFWLAELCWSEGHREEALALTREVYEKSLSKYGPGHALVLVRGNRLAEMLLQSEDLRGAYDILSPQWEGAEISWRNGRALELSMDLAVLYSANEDHDAASRIARRITAIRREHGCLNLPFLEKYEKLLLAPAQKRKDPVLMTKAYEEIVPAFVDALGHGHWATAQRKQRRADVSIGAGKAAEALTMIEQFYVENEKWNHELVNWHISRGRALTVLSRFDEAREALDLAWERCRELGFGTSKAEPFVTPAAHRTAEFYVFLFTRMERPEDQAKWEKILQSIDKP